MTTQYQVHGDIAVITLNNPPVNGMGYATRSALAAAIKAALADNGVRAIVITGAGKIFSGGADIKEFNTPQALMEPTLHTLIDMIENSTKPVLAAIHGICMGGGLELSLACHYRVALTGAHIALPEVKLGILPGAGGTQRLPRAVGLKMALEMIVSGAPVLSEKLAHTALFNEIATENLMQAALAFAHQVADVRPLPKVRDIRIEESNSVAILQTARDAVHADPKARIFPAPLKCIAAIAAAVNLPFEEGLQLERQLFMALVQTTSSKALRHAFFAERAAGKISDVPENTPVRSIELAAVIGAGTMGSGIAINFANAGIPVILVETAQEALDKGLATIRKNYENMQKKGKLSPEQVKERIDLIRGALSYDQIAHADIVIEAVFEDMTVKETVFKKLDAIMKPGAILASNTSTLDIDKIASITNRAQDVVGTHFFSPAHVMRLLEIVRGAKTAHDVLTTALALAKKMKKIGVVSRVCDGFIGNRMLGQYVRQAGFLLEEGCMPEQVDRALEKFGFAMGPFRMNDLAGNDVSWHIRKRRVAEKSSLTYSRIADLLCEAGRFGQKTGAGWYDYEPGERKAYPSPVVADMILKYSADIGVLRRNISDSEIVERLVYALVNEGANILEEGIAMRASDIDVVYLTGYGFPLQWGGPMFYADTVGLANVAMAIKKYAQGSHGEAWNLAHLLAERAEHGKTFH